MDEPSLKVLLESGQIQLEQLPESISKYPQDILVLIRKCYDLERKHLYDEQRDIVQNQIRTLVENFVSSIGTEDR